MVLARHLHEILNERLLAVPDGGLVLRVGLADELLHGLRGTALVEHQVVRGLRVLLIAFEAIGHRAPRLRPREGVQRLTSAMAHPYPHHCPSFDYRGRYRYFLTFPTHERHHVFAERAPVNVVWMQILRAASEKGFEVIAYCFMPDHLHLVVEGLSDDAGCKAFVKSAKQYAGYYYARANGGGRLLQAPGP